MELITRTENRVSNNINEKLIIYKNVFMKYVKTKD